MKNRPQRAKLRLQSISGALLAVMILISFLPNIGRTVAEPPDAAVLYFEPGGLVLEKQVELGTPWEDLELPAELPAVLDSGTEKAEEIIDSEAAYEEKPGEPIVMGDFDTRGEAPEEIIDSEAAEEKAGEPVVMGGFDTQEDAPEEIIDSEAAYEEKAGEPVVAGDFDIHEDAPEEDSGEPADTGAGTDSGADAVILSVPVIWEGVYDGNVPGTYVLTARAEGFEHSGQTPSVAVTVLEGAAAAPRAPEEEEEDFSIDIGAGMQSGSKHAGYTFTAGTTRRIDFSAAANTYTYEIRQTGNMAAFWTIHVLDGTQTTFILNGIKGELYIHLYGSAELTLLLAGENILSKGYITVRENTRLTIDSAAAPGGNEGLLSISSPVSKNAAIGGYYDTASNRSNSGLITIKGGTINATQAGTDIEAAVIGGAYLTSGNIVITGGHVTATTANSSFGAAIGGGRSGTGNVLITGGTVIATVPDGSTGGGAAIGGGAGSGTSPSGVGNVTITGGNVTAFARNGAAIGGGQRSSDATVNITGGTITAETTASGAAIGGGGGTTGAGSHHIAGSVSVTISAGRLKVKARVGAGIGNGGYEGASAPTHDEKLEGSVTITGGTIIADVNEGSGVGTGWNNKVVPNLYISKDADIVVFGRKRTAFAGIYAGDDVAKHDYGINKGNAYYVNLNFPDENLRPKTGQQIVIFAAGDLTSPLRTLSVPFDAGMFSFTTGGTSAQNYNIYMGDSGGLQQLSRLSGASPAVYDNPLIYSVNKTYQYYNNNHVPDNYYRSLPVKTGAAALLIVREIYVDIYGLPVPGKDDTTVMVEAGGYYGKDILTLDNIDGYSVRGHKWDAPPNSGGGDYTPGSPGSTQIKENRDIYYVYAPYREVDVTVSKIVMGDLSGTVRPFTFALALKDGEGNPLAAGTRIYYEGDAILPVNYITLEEGGKAVFSLRDGQAVILKDIPSNAMIKVTEVLDSGHWTMTYTDTRYPGALYEFDMLYETVGMEARAFRFVNTWMFVVPTGLDAGARSAAAAALPLTAPALLLAGLAAAKLPRRRMRTRQNRKQKTR
ncbi:MAG: hypothetical protein FWG93_02950 [Oscillospiraceae bacterium]|nr:hypothetical protein [Oscillospiraceae bacterium]